LLHPKGQCHEEPSGQSKRAYGVRQVESVYFGTRKSKNYIRLYDKRQEQIDKKQNDIGYDLWRLELESKESFYASSALYEKISSNNDLQLVVW
jgi:DNA relaxase NicK